MASSRKSRTGDTEGARASFVVAAARACLDRHVRAGERVVVALSGGRDSMVLLDVLARIARRRRLNLTALHVDHQLNPLAGRWAAFCRAQCRARGIPFRLVRVEVARRDSVEAQARTLRLAAFAAQKAQWVATAHHADDQVETVLYRLLRGTGTRGLAGMPVVRPLQPATHARRPRPHLLRPLLGVTRADIVAYARVRGLKWVEDDSNADLRYDRNYLRHVVLPAIDDRFPRAREALVRAATHAADAEALNAQLARADAAGALHAGTLEAAALQRLSPERGANLLRWFIAGHGVQQPPAARLREALHQLASARADARVRVAWGGVALRRHRGRIHLTTDAPALRGLRVRWHGEPRLVLPGLAGNLVMTRERGRGIAVKHVRGQAVEVRLREGAERLQLASVRPRRALKSLMQEAGIAPWARDRWPLIYVGGALAAVPGIGVDATFRAGASDTGVVPQWHPL